MSIYNKQQKQIAEKINPDASISNWKSWGWQIKHSIKDIATFEKLLNIEFDQNLRNQYDETIKKIPISITPYYLS